MNAFAPACLLLTCCLGVDPAPESYFGVNVATPAFTDEAFGDPEVAAGLEVTSVVENSPGAAAGFKVGDRVLLLNGSAPRGSQHLAALIAAQPVGTHLRFRVRRAERVLDLEGDTVARLEPRKAPDQRHLVEGRRLGLALSTLTDEEASAAGLKPGDGLRVRRLLEGSPAAAVIEPGDLLKSINGEGIHGAEDLGLLLRKVEPGAEIKLEILRGNQAIGLSVTARKADAGTTYFHFPGVVIYESNQKDRETTFGVLLNIFKYTRKENRRTYRFLWFIHWTTGTNEELEEVQE